jgi:hypothetical protein
MVVMPSPLVLSHPAQYQYRNEVPQHQHRDLPSSRVVCHSSVLSDQHGCGCVKFGTKRGTLDQPACLAFALAGDDARIWTPPTATLGATKKLAV